MSSQLTLATKLLHSIDIMTPEEFEENARIVSGDPNWSLDDSIEDVSDSSADWDDFWNSESEGRELKVDKASANYVQDVLEGKNVICKRESPLSE